MVKVELLAPARDLACGLAAIDSGADAVYIGAPRFGARARVGNALDDIAALVERAHIYWARVYVTVNTLLHDDELPQAVRLIHQLYDIGVDAVVNPRMVAVAKILQFIRKGKIFSITSLSDIEAEVIEVEAMETSDLVERSIKDIKWPRDAIIAGVIRGGQGRVIVPRGDTVIDPGDRVIIFAKRGAMPKVEKVLSVKLDYF